MASTGECYGGVCMVDLSVQARLPVGAEVPYIIGSSALLTLLVTVTNSAGGRRNYSPSPAKDVRLDLPLLDSNNLVIEDYPDICSLHKTRYRQLVVCRFDLSVTYLRQLEFVFNTTRIPASQKVLKWNRVKVSTGNAFYRDTKPSNNYVDFSISLKPIADAGISSRANPQRIFYEAERNANGNISSISIVNSNQTSTKRRILHQFFVQNHNITPLQNALVSVDIPTSMGGVRFINEIQGWMKLILPDGSLRVVDCSMDISTTLNGISPATPSALIDHHENLSLNCSTYGVKCSILRCPAISVLSSETKARVTVILDLDLEAFLSVRAPNSSQAFGGLSGGDMLALTLGGHIRFADVEEYLSLPQAINLHPDHVYSSTVMVHVRKSILQTSFWGIVIVGGVATVFFCILLAQGVLIAYRRHNAFYPPSNVPPEYQIYPPNASQHHSSKNYKRDKHKKDKSRAPLPEPQREAEARRSCEC